MSAFDDAVRQITEAHHRELTEQAIAHAAEVGRLKASIHESSEHNIHYRAWSEVVEALNEYAPWWLGELDHDATGIRLAVHAIKKMADRIAELERQPVIPPVPTASDSVELRGCQGEGPVAAPLPLLIKISRWADYADQKGFADNGVLVHCRDMAGGAEAEITWGECRIVRGIVSRLHKPAQPGIDSEGGSHD